MGGEKQGFFWVLAPHLREAIFWGKVRKTGDLRRLANEVHWRLTGVTQSRSKKGGKRNE